MPKRQSRKPAAPGAARRRAEPAPGKVLKKLDPTKPRASRPASGASARKPAIEALIDWTAKDLP